MTVAQYNDCLAQLKKAGAHHPRGRQYHACFGEADKLQVFDIWTNQETFGKFGEILMPILQQIGVDPGQPMVMPIHNIVVPPAKSAAKPAKKAAKAKKKAAPAKRKKAAKKGRR
jgi:hypothetical protein